MSVPSNRHHPSLALPFLIFTLAACGTEDPGAPSTAASAPASMAAPGTPPATSDGTSPPGMALPGTPGVDPVTGNPTPAASDGPSPTAGPTGPAPADTDPVATPGVDPQPGATAQPTDPAPGSGGQPAVPDATEEPAPSIVGDVTLSTPSQAFEGELSITLATTIADAEIRYSIDGTAPTATSTLFDGTALVFTETTQLRAQAFVGGTPSGAMTTGLYIARTFDLSSNLPIVVIDGYGTGKPTDKEVYFDAAVMIFEPDGGTASLSNLPTLATRSGYHIRGQSSASFPQTPYKVEFWDNADQDADHPTMGMPADSDWALIPTYYDRALIRNPFTFDLGREMGLEAPRYAFAEIYLNYEGGPLQEDDYQGIYWFTETIKNNSVRTDLEQLEEDDTAAEDMSGGYIFKFDQAAAEEPIVGCTGSEPVAGGLSGIFGNQGNEDSAGTCWVDLEVVDPKLPNEQQLAWFADYIQTFHDGLHAEPMIDYTQYIDVPSFVDHMIICELTMDVDSYVRSSYYHKDRDGLLKAGPLWDYNFALGGVGAQDPLPDPEDENDDGWMYIGGRNVNNWYPRLSADPAFMDQVRGRYTGLRQTLLSDAAIQQRIDELAEPLTEAAVRDFERWPVSEIITSETGFTGGPTVETWDGQVQVMRDFLTERLAWIDANL